METWFEDTGKPALFRAFTQACSHIEKDFKDSVEAESHKKAEIDAELQLLRVRAANVDRLEQQNKALKEELAELRGSFQRPSVDAQGQENTSPSKPRASRPPYGNPRGPLTPVSVNIRKSVNRDYADTTGLVHHDLGVEYAELDGKYQKLRSQTADLVQANEKLQSELRERTRTTLSWKEYATKQQECAEKRKSQIKRLKEELATATNNTTLASSSTSKTDPNSPNPQAPGVAEANGALDDARNLSNTTPVSVNIDTLLQSGKSPVELNGDNDTSDDQYGGQATEEPTLPPISKSHISSIPDVPVKDEPSSDTPVVVSERPVRKRRREDDSSVRGSAVARVKTEEGSDPAVPDDQYHFMPHESIDFDDAGNSLSAPRRHQNSHQTNTAATSARGITQDDVQNTTGSLHDLASTSGPSALGHVSMGAQTQRRAGALSKKHTASAPEEGNSTLLGGIASIAEDDDRDDTTDFLERPGQTFRNTGRLNSLLTTASPEKRAIARPPRRAFLAKSQTKGFVIPSASTRTTFSNEGHDSVSKESAVSETPTVVRPGTKRPDTSESSKRRRKDLSRLRDRPERSLRLEDFRINPKHNDGLDYAFTEVVRNKDDRLCLPGCVKEECCAPGFRAQARGERLETGAIAFQSLLENWLGDGAWKLSSMSESEKEDLWLKAKTQQVANQYGKAHRHRVQRPSTPPGYFNVDFPSTQQLDEDNQQAAAMQQERVAERYREAMRPNQTGRWLFRDE